MWEQIAANRRKSVVLVVMSGLLLLGFGFVLGEYFLSGGQPAGAPRNYDGGITGAILTGFLWLFMTLGTWFKGDHVLLSMSGARRIEKTDLPILFNVVEEMSLAAGLGKMPAVYVIDDPAPNAFATGRRPENAAVAVTSGLLRKLDRDELQGVIAHELAHIRNRDIQLMLFAGVLAGAIVILAEVGFRGMLFGGGHNRSRRSNSNDGGNIFAILAVVMMILAPIFARLIYLAVSRKREYLADASAATFTRYPEGLASALEKISQSHFQVVKANKASAPMYIINPLQRTGKVAANLSSTHPPIDERVKILRSMGGSGFGSYDESYRRVRDAKKGVLPGSALNAAADSGAIRQASEKSLSGSASNREIARQVDNLFYKDAKYHLLSCPCGTQLKIPPDFREKSVKCPRCGTRHEL